MPNYNNGSKQDVPGQVTFPGDASKGYRTDVDGKIYPDENKRETTAYISEEGSMGFERNQGATRDGFIPPKEELGTMGQKKLQRIKSTMAGSHSI